MDNGEIITQYAKKHKVEIDGLMKTFNIDDLTKIMWKTRHDQTDRIIKKLKNSGFTDKFARELVD